MGGFVSGGGLFGSGVGIPSTPPTFPTGGGTGGGGGGSTLGLSNNTWNRILQGLGIGSSVLGSILNRKKGLGKKQRGILNQLLTSLSSQANAPLTVDPVQRALLFEQIAGSAQGARNRLTNDFAARGLSESGLKGEEFGRVERTAQGAQTAAVADLLNQAQARRTQSQQQLQSLLFGIPSVQGASAAGVGLSSLGEVLGYLLTLNQLGRRN